MTLTLLTGLQIVAIYDEENSETLVNGTTIKMQRNHPLRLTGSEGYSDHASTSSPECQSQSGESPVEK